MNLQKNRFIITLAFCFFLIPVQAENIQFSANSMSGKVGSKTDSTTLSGEAYVLTDSMELSADEISLSGKDFRFIEASTNVKGIIKESEMEFTCGKLKYDRETKKAELLNDVSLTDKKNNVSAKAQMIEYNQTNDIAVMQISVELKQKDNVCTGAYAIYKKNEQMLELSGNSQIKQGQDTFRAQEITLNMETQEITLDGRVKGSITEERKSTKENSETKENNKTEDRPEPPEEPEDNKQDKNKNPSGKKE